LRYNWKLLTAKQNFANIHNRSYFLSTLKRKMRQISLKNRNLSSVCTMLFISISLLGIHFSKLLHSVEKVYKCELKNISQVSWMKFRSFVVRTIYVVIKPFSCYSFTDMKHPVFSVLKFVNHRPRNHEHSLH
jgi:hypothetical protein